MSEVSPQPKSATCRWNRTLFQGHLNMIKPFLRQVGIRNKALIKSLYEKIFFDRKSTQKGN